MKAPNVMDYTIQRLVEGGIEHCLGVPGDYAFPGITAVENGSKVNGFGGYAGLNPACDPDRLGGICGAARLLVTYAFSGRSEINRHMGGDAEPLLVRLLVGAPSEP
jgi:indolepyruvate decarboxylase